jgi:diguanylate cyclase (GGDEF)-like protein
MQSGNVGLASQGDLLDSAGEVSQEEGQINHIAWFGGIAVTAVTLAVLVLLMATADHTWQYAAYLLLAIVPLTYGLFTNIVSRKMQVDLLRKFQTRLIERMTELQEMASRDEMTGLYNRRHFYETLRAEVDRSNVSNESLAILMMDIDGLKGINDEYGHSVGDVVITNVARAIGNQARAVDLAARLGGDEFGVLLLETDKRGAFAMAKRLWEELEQTPMYKEGLTEIMVTVSIGVSGYPWGGEDVGELIQWADTDMYANKVSSKLGQQTVPDDRPTDMEALPDDYVVGI